MTSDATRRHVISGIARCLSLLAPSALLAGCAGSSTGGIPSTGALGSGPSDGPVPKEKPGAPVKIAVLLPLEGGIQLSLMAKGLRQAAELALFERNINGFQLIFRDDKGTPEGAAKAATEALSEGAELILGPLFSASVTAVAPIAQKAGVPVIAFSNDPALAGRGPHLLSFFSSSEATRAVTYTTARGKRHIAALIPGDTLGKDTEPAFRRSVEAAKASLAVVEHYASDLGDIAEPAERVMAAIRGSAETEDPVDALFLPSASENVPRLLAVLHRHALDVKKTKLILTSGWDNPSALRDPILHGAWLAAPDPVGWREFTARFGQAYQAAPPRLASLVYDAVTVAASFATQPPGQRFTSANLTRPAGFSGIDGPFRLTASGLVERSLAVLEFQPQGLVMIDPAAGFTPADAAHPSARLAPATVAPG